VLRHATDDTRPDTANLSKAAAVLGAAGLLLYIMGVKRRHRLDNERETVETRRSERRDG
jgi:hypothetical protein